MKNNELTMVKVEGELFVSKADYDKLAASFSTLMEQLAITNEAVNRENKLANQYRDKCDKLAAECAALKAGPQGFFSYGSDSGYAEFSTAKEAIESAECEIDYYRGEACDGWSDEVDQVCWGIVIQRSTMTDLRSETSDDGVKKEICDYSLLPPIETPDTDAAIAELKSNARKEGIIFATNKILAAWESGFIDDTPAQAFDISGAVLSALEFLPNASDEEFKRDYADEVRAAIAAQLRAGVKG
ncbi:hypothetical protein LLS47_12205 [Rouxiella badensis]|uniref:hypothetical protein n=1 Tax=Rouxiella badensis TaxID=1646377 RepID=UPI001D14B28E|nr:hypothetical protein [Rouxiella badensis]MCC3733690.1 hypothetical protein [Rouxiella badensis]MCC3759656.1 hypothetical protein [Rouxiella badensis]